MTDNLFEQKPTDQQTKQIDNYLEELVGENKKFKTAEELAKGKYIADQYIEHKNREYDTLRADYLKVREELDARAKWEEIADKLTKTSNSEPTTHANEEIQQPTLDATQLEELIKSRLNEHEVQKTFRNNIQEVETRLKERYGANYAQVLKQETEGLGLSEDQVNDLARRAPKTLYRMLGIDQQSGESFNAPPKSTQTFAPKQNKRDWAYYEEMRKNDPKNYHNPKTQTQMFKDAAELGEQFKTGNWIN